MQKPSRTRLRYSPGNTGGAAGPFLWLISFAVYFAGCCFFASFLAGVSRAAEAASSLSFSVDPTDQEIFKAHLFEEPLIPIGGEPSAGENKALASALLAYSSRKSNDDVSALTGFITANPSSPWNVALLTNLGFVYYHTGQFTRTLDAWGQAWELGKNATGTQQRALVDLAAGELAKMESRLGRTDQLESLLNELSGRQMPGAGGVLIHHAREALQVMHDRPQISYRCGPFALNSILHFLNPQAKLSPLILNSASAGNGTSLDFVANLAGQIGLKYQMAYREDSSEIPMPAVVNWKAGHYAALVEKKNGRYHSEDPTFGNDVWISPQTLDEQSSGYFLIPAGLLPPGWRAVSEAEGAKVFGKGFTDDDDPDSTTDDDDQIACNNCSCIYVSDDTDDSDDSDDDDSDDMATFDFFTMLVSLHLTDTPLFYTPPLGPRINFTVTYNSLEANQPAVFTYSNFGPQWTFNWLSYITDDPTTRGSNVTEYVRGGGTVSFLGYDGTSAFQPELLSHALLKITSTSSYSLTYPDGSQQIYSLSNGATSYPRNIFLTKVIDHAGNAVTLAYDANFRITTITDAIGQVTTLSYGLAGDMYKITGVTDPFGRKSGFGYNASDVLVSDTDTGGISSAFAYNSSGFLDNLTTPYGSTVFTTGTGANQTTWIQAVDPLGGTERLEFNERADVGVPNSEPNQVLPQGMNVTNQYLTDRNSFFWSKEAWQQFPGDYSKAYLTHFLHDASNINVTGRVPESVKPAFENRTTYNYAGQSSSIITGTSSLPTAIGRVLDDGSTQLSQFQYNPLGKVLEAIDPLGRTTINTYAANNVDLLSVQQVNPATSGTDLLATYTYNALHEPNSITDASGRKTTISYNAKGQPLTVTDPKGDQTTLNYNTNGYLTSVVGPLGTSGTDTTTFTYDSFGRVATAADTQGYTLTYSYDALNRITKISYPDGTSDQYTYNRLDPSTHTDRLGRVTTYTYDALRHLVETQDPLNRLTYYNYCTCGALTGIIDPLGRATHFSYDAESRLTSKTYADGSTEAYAYENTTSRLKSHTDEKGQVTNYQYYRDNNVHVISYSNSQVDTPAVTYAYDPAYNRITSMRDGAGLTTYAYNPITGSVANGSGLLAAIHGPLPNGAITYSYDALGRVISQSVGGITQTAAYDALGRVTSAVNPLGTFAYAYTAATPRLAAVTLPNGQSTQLSYFNNAGNERLQEILNLKPGSVTLSKFTYAYNAVGDITTWTQQQDSNPANTFALAYDAADQLLSGTSPAASYHYTYDSAGNRLAATSNSSTTSAIYNSLNQLASLSGASIPATTYQWDACQRLTSIVSGSNTSQFVYDGLGRRSEIIQKSGTSVVSTNYFLWNGYNLAQERDSTGGVIVKQYYPQGVVESGSNLFYSFDHLGSIREMTDHTDAIRARYSYDPYGSRAKVSGDLDADFGFTGFYYHGPSGFQFATFRGYDATAGRWLSRDPMGEEAGLNLYAYVGNSPLNSIDPFGLDGFGSIGAFGGFGSGNGPTLSPAVGALLSALVDEVNGGPSPGAQTVPITYGYDPLDIWGGSTPHPELAPIVEQIDNIIAQEKAEENAEGKSLNGSSGNTSNCPTNTTQSAETISPPTTLIHTGEGMK